MNIINTIEERYEHVLQSCRENMATLTGKTVFTVRQNRREGTPTLFEKAAIPIEHLHVLDLSVKQMPNGDPGLLFRLNNAKPPTTQYADTVGVGGQGPQQALAMWLNKEPTSDGRGSCFGWGDELLAVALTMAEVLVSSPVNGPVQLPRVLGTKPSQTLLESLQAAAETPGDYSVLRAQCSGEVTFVCEAEQGLPGYVRIVQQSDSSSPLSQESVRAVALPETSGAVQDVPESVPQGFQPLVAEENVPTCDEVVILPGTLAVVTVGQVVEMGDPILELDPEAVGRLSESQVTDLAAVVEFAAQSGHCAALAVDTPVMHIGTMPLFAGVGATIPAGKLYFDIVQMVGVDGAPVYQVVDTGRGIMSSSNLRVDLRPTAISWPRQSDFVRPSAATIRQQETRQRTRKLRGLGEEAALAQLVTEAIELPSRDYDLKLDHLSSGPFPLGVDMAKEVHTFSMHIRMGDHAARTPAEKAVLINEYLQGFWQ